MIESLIAKLTRKFQRRTNPYRQHHLAQADYCRRQERLYAAVADHYRHEGKAHDADRFAQAAHSYRERAKVHQGLA